MVEDFLAGLKKVNWNLVYNVALGVAASKLVIVTLKAVVGWVIANLTTLA